MHTRRDQVEAHTFVANRMRAAILRAEPDALRPPLRRTPTGLLVGVLVGVIVTGIAALIGVLHPSGGSKWRAAGTLIVAKGTGSRYLLVDGRLHPVLNYASARLLLGPKLKEAEAPAKQLDDLPLGSQIGIPWAPDSLPPAGASTSQHWVVCAATDAASQRPTVTLTLDPETAPTAGSATDGVVVRDPSGTSYLVTDGRRMKITADWVARAFGSETITPPTARTVWLDLLPAGPDLGSLAVDGRGSSGPTLAGETTRIGEIVTASGANGHQYLVVAGGLLPLSPTAAALALADPQTAAAYPGRAVGPVALGTAALAAAAVVPVPDSMAELPPKPRLLTTDAHHGPCLHIDSTATSMRRTVSVTPAGDGPGAVQSTPGVTVGPTTADGVAVAAGGGALARSTPVAGVATGGLFLVTGDGIKYPIAGNSAATALGYSPQSAVPVPPAVLALLPTGPRLTDLGGGA